MGSIENMGTTITDDGGLHVEWEGSRDVLSDMVASRPLWLMKLKLFKIKDNLKVTSLVLRATFPVPSNHHIRSHCLVHFPIIAQNSVGLTILV